MEIHGLNKTTLLDYPGRLAATVFTGRCNFRCPFCQNSDLVLYPSGQPAISEDEVLDFLKKRKGILQGVCITGGEPTLNKDLYDFLVKIKDIGIDVKLDTNGYRPEILKNLIYDKLVSFVAMDVKSSKEGYPKASGLEGIDISVIEKSVDILKHGHIDYEFRTTVVKGLHTMEDFDGIAKWLLGAKSFFLQNYRDGDRIMKDLTAYPGFVFGEFAPFSEEELEKIVERIKPYVPAVSIRGESS